MPPLRSGGFRQRLSAWLDASLLPYGYTFSQLATTVPGELARQFADGVMLCCLAHAYAAPRALALAAVQWAPAAAAQVCITAHLLHTRCTNIFGTPISAARAELLRGAAGDREDGGPASRGRACH